MTKRQKAPGSIAKGPRSRYHDCPGACRTNTWPGESPVPSAGALTMLNAVTCVWNEEDIIAAAVKNCFAQGCEKVFIVDNGSTDATVPRALAAGARLAISFNSKFFDERQKIIHLNAVVRFFNELCQEDRAWWLYFDADEFPCAANGARLIDLLRDLDDAIVGLQGYLHNHIPTHFPYTFEDRHPADFMPLCEKNQVSKIPLLRYDKNRPPFFSAGGAHEFDSNGQSVLVAMEALDIHHFPVRSPEHSLGRLKKLLQRSADGSSRVDWMDNRSRLINRQEKSHYHERYENMRARYRENKNKALECRALDYDFQKLRRWYEPGEDRSYPELDAFDNALCRALLQYFLGRHDVALCRFNDALNVCTDAENALWLMVKMAECFAPSDAGSAKLLLTRAFDSGHAAVRAYIKTWLADVLLGKPCAVAPLPPQRPVLRVESYQGSFQIDQACLREQMRLVTKRLARLHS